MSDPKPIRIQVLGRFSVEANGQVVIDRSWSRRKALAAIKLLSLKHDHSAHREELLDALWPELEPAAALNNLHKNLHHIRSALGKKGVSSPLVALNGEMVELPAGVEVDADVFRRLSREALSTGDLASFERAAAVYQGELLPEDAYEDWTESEREDLRARYIELMLGLARASDAAGNHGAAIDALQSLLRSDQLNEEAHRLLMVQFAHSGSKHRALRQYQTLSDLLREELHAEPSEDTRALYESLLGAPAESPEAVAPADGAPQQPRHSPVVFEPGHHARQVSPTFGRDDELETAQELIDGAQEGRGSAVLISGEIGVGKTHFVQQMLADAEDQGFLTATSRCSELESSSAYQAFRDVLRQLNGAGTEDLVRYSPHLRRILRGSSESDHTALDPTLFQTELFNEAQRLLEQVSLERPVLLCLEDFHEADEDSIRMFHFLARRVSGLRAVLVASSREESRRASLSSLIASLRRDQQIMEINLRPLDDQSMRLLVENALGERGAEAPLLREILESAEGNPLYATEIVHTLKQEGWARLSGDQWTRREQVIIPSAVNELLDLRLKRLSPTAQAQVQLAAVHGRDVDYALLRATLELSEREALDALDECIETNIIEETEDGYRFRHQLLREGIYGRLTRVRRQSLHKAVARSLESRRPDPLDGWQVEEISHHYALSDEPWVAVPYLLEAGRRAAAVFANQQAASFHERVISLVEEHREQLVNVDLTSVIETLGDIERRRGNTERSVELFEQVSSSYADAGDFEAASRVRGKAALGHIMLGRAESARRHLSATLQDLTAASPQSVVSRTYYLLAQLHWHSGDNRQALEAAERSLVAAGESNDPNERAQAFEVLALACHSLGDWQRGVELELERQALGVPGFNTDEAFEAHL